MTASAAAAQCSSSKRQRVYLQAGMLPGTRYYLHTIYTLYLHTIYSVGAVVVVLCDAGYTALANTTLECTEQGAWSAQIPACVDI